MTGKGYFFYFLHILQWLFQFWDKGCSNHKGSSAKSTFYYILAVRTCERPQTEKLISSLAWNSLFYFYPNSSLVSIGLSGSHSYCDCLVLSLPINMAVHARFRCAVTMYWKGETGGLGMTMCRYEMVKGKCDSQSVVALMVISVFSKPKLHKILPPLEQVKQ